MATSQPAGRPPRSAASRRGGLGRKVLVFVAVLSVAAGGATYLFGRGPARGALQSRSYNTFFTSATVTRTKVTVTVPTRGDIESAKNLDVVNLVEGQTTILFIKPEGSPVKKGELVCELDSAALRDSLTNQIISTRKALTDYQSAVKTREVAEFSVREYLEGTFPQSEQAQDHAIRNAVSELERVSRQLEWSERMFKVGYVTPSQLQGDKLTVGKAEISLREARTRLQVLREYTRRKQITELQAAVDQARSDESAKQLTFDLEKSKEEKLRTQVARCKMYAPADGMIVYANDSTISWGAQGPKIEEGATVRERQRILSLPDVTRMRVNAKLDEALIAQVTPGQRAKIRIDAMAVEPLEGTVEAIRPIAAPNQFSLSDTRTHTTLIRVDQPPTWMRPGMTAQVEILVSQSEDALAIPVSAVLQYHGKNHVYVASPEGPRRREIRIGTHNDKLIEVKDGLREGENVALEPGELMTEAERREAFALESPDAPDQPWDDKAVAKSNPERGAEVGLGAGG